MGKIHGCVWKFGDDVNTDAINQGLLILVCLGIAEEVREGQELEVDLGSGLVKNSATGKTLQTEPLPDFVLEILGAGGLIPWLKRRLHGEGVDAVG